MVKLLLPTDIMAIDTINVYFLDIDRIQFEVFEKINEITSLCNTSSEQSEVLDERRASLAQNANGLISKIPGLLAVIDVQIKQENPTLIETTFTREKLELYLEKVSYLKLKLKESQLVAYSLESELTHKQRLEEYVKDEKELSSDLREDLFTGRSQAQATDSERPIDEQVLIQNKNITSTLKMTKQLMTMSVMQTELNIDGLDQQSKDLNTLNDKLVDLQGVLIKSRQIVKFIEKQDKRDRRRIYCSIGFLLVCCAWVLWRRVLKMPVKILMWSFLKFFGVLNWAVSKYPSDKLGVQVTAGENFPTTMLASSYANSFETSLVDLAMEEESLFTILPIKDEEEEEMQFSILPIDVEAEEEMEFSILPIDVATETGLTETISEPMETHLKSEEEERDLQEEIEGPQNTESSSQEFQPIELDAQGEVAEVVEDEHSSESDPVIDDSSLEARVVAEPIEEIEDVPIESGDSQDPFDTSNNDPEVDEQVEETEIIPVAEDEKTQDSDFHFENVQEAELYSELAKVAGVQIETVEELHAADEAAEMEPRPNDEADGVVDEVIKEDTYGVPVEDNFEESTETADASIEVDESSTDETKEPTSQQEEPILQAEESFLEREPPILRREEPAEESKIPPLSEATKEADTIEALQAETYESIAEEFANQNMDSVSEYVQDVKENQQAHTWED